MERTINTKFFTFNQNNSGGYFIVNDDVAGFVIVEAQNADEAMSKMFDITGDYSEYCECCGERWSISYTKDKDGTEEPIAFGCNVKENKPSRICDGSSTIIYYYDGTKEKLWYE